MEAGAILPKIVGLKAFSVYNISNANYAKP